MKQHRSDLAKYSLLKSYDGVPLPSHFSPVSFTIGAFDNFDFNDKNSLSGAYHTHDTASILCQRFHLKLSLNQTKAQLI
jgi:hypothetical protein